MRDKLVQVTLVVRVPGDVEDTEGFLNDTSFDCNAPNGTDIYERVDGYEVIGEAEGDLNA